MAAVNHVALFIVLTSLSIVLSLYTAISEHFKTGYADVPQIVVLIIMMVGMILMITFLIRVRKQREVIDMDDRDVRRHYCHTFMSLTGIVFFYAQSIILDVNHLIAGFDCLPNWSLCDNRYVVRYHVVDLIFHVFKPVFMGLQCAICFIMVHYSLARNAWIVHGVAIVQSANIAICFQSILMESYAHHHETSLEINFLSTSCWHHEQNNSWSDCPTSTNDTTECCWPKDNQLLRWIESSGPSLYPVAIELSVLVGEIMLEKLYRRRHTTKDTSVHIVDKCVRTTDEQSRHDIDDDGLASIRDADGCSGSTDDVRQDRPTTAEQQQENGGISADNDAAGNDRENQNNLGCVTAIYQLLKHSRFFDVFRVYTKTLPLPVAICVFFVVIPVLCDAAYVLVIYIGIIKLHQPIYIGDQTAGEYYTVYIWWSIIANLLMICMTIIGLISLRHFPPRHHDVHTSSLDYLPLVCSTGSFLLSIRVFIESILNNAGAIYIIKPLLNVPQVLLQIMFLYKVKELQIKASKRKLYIGLCLFLAAMALLNLMMWMADSLTVSEHHDSVGWQSFDSIVGSLNAFFRFSSALLFASILIYAQSLRDNTEPTQSDQRVDQGASSAADRSERISERIDVVSVGASAVDTDNGPTLSTDPLLQAENSAASNRPYSMTDGEHHQNVLG